MRLELYVAHLSPVHALHPATKLFLLAVALLAPLLTVHLAAQAIALAAFTGAALAGRVLRACLAPFKLLLFLFVVTFALWGAFGQGGPTISFAYAMRVTVLFLFGLLFLATTRTEEVVHALEVAFVPYRLAFALGLAFRLVPLLLQSAASIVEAQRARGLDLERGTLTGRFTKFVPILVPIFMTALRSADQMAMALDARGFGAKRHRTRLRHYAFGRYDIAALLLGVAFAVAEAGVAYLGGLRLAFVPR